MEKCKHEGCIIKTDSETGYCSSHIALHRNDVPIPAVIDPVAEAPVELPKETPSPEPVKEDVVLARDERPASRQELRLVAVQPSEMERAQRDLVGWAERRLAEENAKCDELDQNYQLALKHKWRSGPFKNALNVAAKRVVAFEKILGALKQGYVIIPDFPVTIIAIRTEKELPTSNYKAHNYGWAPSQPDQKAQELPVGVGNYVNPRPEVSAHTQRWTEPNGENMTHTWSRATAFQDVEFPFILAKPAVLDATARAMTDKIFDEIGISPQQPLHQQVTHQTTGSWKHDPMIIGRIHIPTGLSRKRTLSFMIAWFLDESMLP